MRVLGLVVEYNPFHNGHLYHLEQSKKLTGADYAVCVMSGNFIQRGEPAVINKWARAKAAILSGVDLVIELPVVFAMSSAEYFAFGAVKILDSLGIVDCICFGSEQGNVNELDMIASTLSEEPQAYKSALKNFLNSGLSFPSAREQALKAYFQETRGCVFQNMEEIIGSSNNILGIEYLKALKKLNSGIEPYTITRVGNAYNSEKITGSISSATAIRKLIASEPVLLSDEKIKEVLPGPSLKILKGEIESGRGPVFASGFEDMILSHLRRLSVDELKNFPYISEGLENRIKTAAENSGSFEELVENVNTKRYTRTRIQRSLFCILNGISSEEFDEFLTYGGPQYSRVLGFNNKGRQLLSEINKASTLPVIIKTADFKNSCNRLLKRMLELEAAATDMYVLGYSNPEYRKSGQEFTQNIIRE